MYSPWEYVEKYKDSKNIEHVHQTVLFQWANMAANFGLNAADQPKSYTEKGYAQALLMRTIGIGSDLRIPQLNYLFAIRNQGHGDQIRGARARAEGLKVGVPDICLPLCIQTFADFNAESQLISDGYDGYDNFYSGLYIELKRPQTMKAGQRKLLVIDKAAGKASTKQEEWQAFLRQQGYVCEICYGWEEARDLILNYLREGGLI